MRLLLAFAPCSLLAERGKSRGTELHEGVVGAKRWSVQLRQVQCVSSPHSPIFSPTNTGFSRHSAANTFFRFSTFGASLMTMKG